VLPDRSATSDPNDRRQAHPLLMGSAGRHSKLCGRREERDMAMITEVRCLPHTRVRHLAPELRGVGR
jgi:hypothetical protein